MKEEWKDVIGFEGRYQVSNLGKVKSMRYEGHKGERELKQSTDKLGYKLVYLYDITGKRRFKLVHRLVAQAFVNNVNNYREVNHLDGNKTNNKADNLEWCSHSQNIIHASKVLRRKMGTRKRVMCIETGEVYESGHDAARAKGMCKNAISCVLGKKHQSETAGGFHWKFV